MYEYKHYVCIGYSEDMGRGLECLTCWQCGANHFTQHPYTPNFLERMIDKIRGVDVVDFTDKKLPSPSSIKEI